MNDRPQLPAGADGSTLERRGMPCRAATVRAEVAVIGGGMAGICAAVAAARNGAKTTLIQDRSVLGGNASSEIRVCVSGAQGIGQRETGIIEEILLENRLFNPQDSYTVWDHILYDFVTREKNLDLMLNTRVTRAEGDGQTIRAAVCSQFSTETEIRVEAQLFIDCSGDGLLAASAGATYRTGREGSGEFNESFAPPVADGWQMGASLLLSTRDMGRPMPYSPPAFARKLKAEDLVHREITMLQEGFWWIELGSEDDIIAEQEDNRHALMGYLHGVWDYIKNSGNHPEAESLVLDWVGSVPGKRESRRFMGDFVLSETDLTENRHFDDAVAFGGWPIDEHCPGGILSPDLPPTNFYHHFKEPYQIPFRSLYSRDIDNLLFAGRNISQTHIALASSRVMATGAVMGQAVGSAGALCLKHGMTPRELGNRKMAELQGQLLLDDAFIPGRAADGAGDWARQAVLSASTTSSGSVASLIDGYSRDTAGECHHWESDGLEAWIQLDWPEVVPLARLHLKLDTDLRAPMWKVMKKKPVGSTSIDPMPPKLIQHLVVEHWDGAHWQVLAEETDIHTRSLTIDLSAVSTSCLRVRFLETHGHPNARIYELRCY